MDVLLKGVVWVLETAIDLLKTEKAAIEIAELREESQLLELRQTADEFYRAHGHENTVCVIKDADHFRVFVLYDQEKLFPGYGVLGMEAEEQALSELFALNKTIYSHFGGTKLWEDIQQTV